MRNVLMGLLALVLVVQFSGCVVISSNDHRYEGHGEHGDAGEETGILSMVVSDGEEEQPAMVYVPRDYDPDEEWPLIVFLHGAGERGDDGITQVSVGIATHILSNPERFPAIVYMPQCPRGAAWGARANRDRPDASGFVTDGIEQILERYNIDEDRVSLTGLSMGGYGTFMYGAQNIERFSALMPICGGGNVEDAAALAKRPIRVFHGGADDVVPPERSREMVEAIKEAGGDVYYEEFPDVDHWSWDLVYENESNISWLLEQRR